VQGGPKADAFGALRRSGEHGQGIGGDGELGEEVVIDDGVHIEACFVGVLDLPEDFPGQVVV
jgi:hypothetical protein